MLRSCIKAALPTRTTTPSTTAAMPAAGRIVETLRLCNRAAQRPHVGNDSFAQRMLGAQFRRSRRVQYLLALAPRAETTR